MELKDLLTLSVAVAAVLVAWIAPLQAVRIGRKLNEEKGKLDAKNNLFHLLFALRGTPTHPEFVHALNRISLVFHDNKEVLGMWNKYYDALFQKGHVDPDKVWERHRKNVLLSMAKALGYDLPEDEITKDAYQPEGHKALHDYEWKMREAQLNYHVAATEMCLFSIDSFKLQNGELGQERSAKG